MEKEKMVIDNRMTAAQLMRSEGATLDIVRNPNTGKLFFACGSKKGYISKNVVAKLDSLEPSEIQYGEVHAVINGKPEIVATLFLAATNNVVKSFKL